MTLLTKEQRKGLCDLYSRFTVTERRKLSYLKFRRTVRPEIGGFGAIMVPWKGMWVGIEKDGYTHT